MKLRLSFVIGGAAVATALMAAAPFFHKNHLVAHADQGASGFGTSFPKLGNATASAGGAAKVDLQWANSTFPTENMGGYWSQKVYNGFAFNKECNGANTDADGNAPCNALLTLGYANGTTKDVVANMGIVIANANRSSLFGFNFIATSTGHKSAIFRGGEIDVEPATTDTPLPGSGGLFLNVFNKNLPGAAIQTGGHSGSFANGLMCDGISTNGSCLAAVGGSTQMGSLVNASTGTYTDGAFITGTGISHGFGWGTGGGGRSPYTYGDRANNFILQLGLGGSMTVKKSDNSATLFTVSANGVQLPGYTVASLPRCGASNAGAIVYVTDARTPTYNGVLSGGGVIKLLGLCNGSAWTSH